MRLKPFIDACELPPLPSGQHILSHDQIEAVLMRRAGYEVRVLPEEDLGWEENPLDAGRILAPGFALVPGQHAVLAFSGDAGTQDC